MATARTMISLPEELKDRMSKHASSVNWSAVARKAIEEKLTEFEKPKWTEISLQLYDNDCAGDVISLKQWAEDRRTELGMLMTNCKDMRHDDPGFRDWYQAIRNLAGAICDAIDQLEEASKHPGTKPSK